MPQLDTQVVILPHTDATISFGAQLARVAKAGDVFALVGTLGAGKSTLARGFIRARTTPTEDVPSPTFTLVQSYTHITPEIWHVDAYRLSDPSEAIELGLEEALDHAICLIEWPNRLAEFLPQDRTIWIKLEADSESSGRRVTIAAPPGWFQNVTLT